MRQSTSADQPEVMCTTVPPAKSMALIAAAGLSGPAMRPSVDQTMCAKGKYTTNIQTPTKSRTAENFMRSATAPTMRAGVMMAKESWNMHHMTSLIQW